MAYCGYIQTNTLYAKNGITLSDADAREEVVSDYIGSLIYDKEHMGKVADKLSHPVLTKIRDVVSDFLDYFRRHKMTADERLAKGSLRAIDRAFARAANSVRNDAEVTKYNLGDTPESFKNRQKRAVENRGTVMPGLNEAEVKVVNVPRHNFYGTGKEALASSEEWAKDNIVGSHTYIHNGYKPFDYEISNKSIEKYLSYTSVSNSDNMGVHLAVLKKLPEVINESIEVEEHPDYSKGKDGKRNENNAINDNELIHRFYGSVLIDGKVYRVKTTFKEYKDNSHHPKAYTYEVTKIELIEAPFTDTNRNSNLVAMTTTNSIPLAKLLNGVEKSYDKGKILLDESKKSALSADGDKFSLRKGGKEYRNNGYTQREDGTNNVGTFDANNPDTRYSLREDAVSLKKILNDGSLYLGEQITASKAFLASQNEADKTLLNEFVRSLTGNLSFIRKAMSAQKYAVLFVSRRFI